jgi:ABC-type phosphate transport system permease subunit
VLVLAAALAAGAAPVLAQDREAGQGDPDERGGLTASTLLTLVVVPVAYTLVDDASSLAGRSTRALAARLGLRRASDPATG